MTPTATTNSSQLTRQEINQKQKEFIFPSVTTYYSDPLPVDHALMQHVWDVDGKKYLDFFGGIERAIAGKHHRVAESGGGSESDGRFCNNVCGAVENVE